MPLRMIPEDRRDREKEQRRRRGVRRKRGLLGGTARKPNPSGGPGSKIDDSRKPKVTITTFQKEGPAKRFLTPKTFELYSKGGMKKMLTGGQSKIAAKAPPTNKIDEKDFAVLRKEKAKGRGKGLQDEKMKPGKVMKARRGKLIPLKKDPTKAISSVKPSIGGKGSGTTNLGNPRKKGDSFLKRRLKLSGRIGAAAAMLGLAGAGAAKLGQTIGRKYDEMKKKKSKKMGGGMMKRPMGYTKGGGADTGTVGEMKSRLGVGINKAKRLARKMRDTDRLTERDIAEAKKAVSKKMGGGMMQRPMGMMKKGQMVKARGGGMARTKPTKMF